jgi:hypothetical protein
MAVLDELQTPALLEERHSPEYEAVLEEAHCQQELENNEFQRIWIESWRWLPMALVLVLFGGSILILEMVLQKPHYVTVKFAAAAPGRSADEQTLASIRRMGDLFVVDYKGDYEARLQQVEALNLREASTGGARACSLFAAPTRMGEQLLAHNMDQRDLPVLVRYAAPGKYRSFGFDPFAVSLLGRVYGNPNATEADRRTALMALPFYVTDGMNEKGLAIGLAGTAARRVERSEGRRPTYVLLFIRRALDSAKNVDEVAKLVETMDLYHDGVGTISHQFVATDAGGNWLVIDYPDGRLRLTRGRGTQVRTNQVAGAPAAEATKVDVSSPGRYEMLTRALKERPVLGSEADAMELLADVHNGTAWSVVFNTQKKTGVVVAVGKYRTQYQFGFGK